MTARDVVSISVTGPDTFDIIGYFDPKSVEPPHAGLSAEGLGWSYSCVLYFIFSNENLDPKSCKVPIRAAESFKRFGSRI